MQRPGIRFICSLLFVFICCTLCHAQKKLFIEKGRINFTSYAQLELIKAISDKIIGIIDPVTNQFIFSVDISSFKGFNSALQREHFMENYMESVPFPKAKFKGKIIEQIDFSKDTTYEIRAKGDLDIHGIKQNRIIKGKITITNGNITIESHFIVPLSDHNISIPKIVSQKIATEIQVDFKAFMTPQK